MACVSGIFDHQGPILTVVESNLRDSQGIDGLIGRDLLKDGLLIYHGYNGQFTLAF